MADTGIVEIGGKRMKPCPGWEGNSFRCGRGTPRLIPEDGEVCENCSRGMRKRGQKTREEEERAAEQKRKLEARIERGRVKALEAADLSEPAPLDPEAGALAVLVSVVQAIEALTDHDIEPREWRYGTPSQIGVGDRWQILRAVAGLPVEEKVTRRGWT